MFLSSIFTTIKEFFRDLFNCIVRLHIRHCSSDCCKCESDCTKTPPQTPAEEKPILN